MLQYGERTGAAGEAQRKGQNSEGAAPLGCEQGFLVER